MVWKVEAENFEQKARRGQESNTEQPSSNPNWGRSDSNEFNQHERPSETDESEGRGVCVNQTDRSQPILPLAFPER